MCFFAVFFAMFFAGVAGGGCFRSANFWSNSFTSSECARRSNEQCYSEQGRNESFHGKVLFVYV